MNKKINILFLWNEFTVMGGIERVIFRLLNNLDRDKYNVEICCLFKETGGVADILLSDIKKLGFPVYHLGMDTAKLYDLRALFKLTKLILTHKIKIIRTFSIYATRFGVLAGILSGFRNVIASYHNIYASPVSLKTYIIDSFIYSYCKAVIVGCAEMQSYCLRRFKINPKKIHIINEGIDTETIPVYSHEQKQAIKKNLNIADNDLVLISIGRLEKAKAFDILIEAYSQVVNKFTNTKLLIVGDGSLKNELKMLVAQKKLVDKVIFTGYQKDVYQYLAIAELYILSSLYEGTPNVISEAMLMKIPIVSTDVGHCRSVLTKKNCESGIIVPVNDAEAISRSILDLLNNPQKRKRMGENGRHVIMRDYRAEIEIFKNEQLFNKIAA